jgi:signal peptidase II
MLLKTSKLKRLLIICGLLLLTVSCDQISKEWARENLQNLRTYTYFSRTLTFRYAENTGAFLSLGSSLSEGLRFWIFIFAVGVFLTYTSFQLFRKNNMDWGTTFALTFLTGGGIGNLIDRLHRGYVTDFIHFEWGPLRTGVFNVADMAIVGGILLFSVVSFQMRNTRAA